MRVLCIHADRFEYEVKKKAAKVVEEVAEGAGKRAFGESLVAFVTVEKADEQALDKVVRKAAKDICGQKSREFWQWWLSVAPLRCAEIREGRTGLKVCQRLGKLAAAKIEELLRPA